MNIDDVESTLDCILLIKHYYISNNFTWHGIESWNAKTLNLAFSLSIDVQGNRVRYREQTGLILSFDMISGYSLCYNVNCLVIWFGLSSSTTL